MSLKYTLLSKNSQSENNLILFYSKGYKETIIIKMHFSSISDDLAH